MTHKDVRESQDKRLHVVREAYRMGKKGTIYFDWQMILAQGTKVKADSPSQFLGRGQRLSEKNLTKALTMLVDQWGEPNLEQSLRDLVTELSKVPVPDLPPLQGGSGASGDREPRIPRSPRGSSSAKAPVPKKERELVYVGAEPPPGHDDPNRPLPPLKAVRSPGDGRRRP